MESILHCSAVALAAAIGCGEVTEIDSAALFPEGPWVEDSGLYYVQYAGHSLNHWDGDALRVLWQSEGCGPSAVAAFGEALLVTCYDAGTLVEVSRAGDTLTTWDADSLGEPLVGPNDLTPDGAGGMFVTASGPWESAPIAGKIYWLTPGVPAPEMVADDLHYANGIALGPQDGRIYVAESEAGRIVSFAVTEGPGLGDRRLFARLADLDPRAAPNPYPDGIEFGPDGNLWIGQYSSGRILVAAPDATLAGALDLPALAVPNLAFSADGKILYVAAVDSYHAPYPGRLLAVRLTGAASR